jgi:acyl-coenzyme A thioesterase PaaI-like protein
MHLCVGCEALGHCRYGLTSERLDGDEAGCFELTCPPEHEGGPGVAHAGWTAGVLSEAVSRMLNLHGLPSLVAQLSVDYERPVPVGHPLRARSWVEGQDGNRRQVVGELTLVSSGTVVARARGVSVVRDRDVHYSTFERWLSRESQSS